MQEFSIAVKKANSRNAGGGKINKIPMESTDISSANNVPRLIGNSESSLHPSAVIYFLNAGYSISRNTVGSSSFSTLPIIADSVSPCSLRAFTSVSA